MRHLMQTFTAPLVFSCALVFGATSAFSSIKSDRVGEFRGYKAFDVHLKNNLLAPIGSNNGFAFYTYLGDSNQFEAGLYSLLGGFSGGDTGQSKFQNGTPNGVNILVWQMGIRSLTKSMAQVCVSKQPMFDAWQLKPSVFEAFAKACAMSAEQDNAVRRDTLASLWLQVLGYELPEEEYLEFIEVFASDQELLTMAPESRLQELLIAMLLHPLHLLEN